MTTIEPRTFPTYREFTHLNQIGDQTPDYEKLAYLIKKYGCPVTKVSDGETWMRIYFEIPTSRKEQFLKEEKES